MIRFLLLTILAFSPTVCAQIIVKGNAYDTEKNPAGGVIVRLYDRGKLRAFATTDLNGEFSIKVTQVSDSALLRFISQNHATLDYPLSKPAEPIKVYLEHKSFMLQELTVKAPERRIKGDTIVYDVAALTKNGDRSIEDIIKKIPGIQVDGGGGIYYDGRPINHFYIEDLDLMGGNYSVASRNINPSDVSSVSVYERHQDKKVLKGSVESERAALNLKLKKGRMLKPLGYVEAASGAGDDVLWKASLYSMLISPKNQTIVSAMGNNTGELYGKRLTDDRLNLFSFTPFGEPPIKKDRFVDNTSAFATANTLFKLGKDLTVKVNSSYDRNRERFDGSTVTDYLNPDGEDIIYSESVDNRPEYQNVAVGLNVENNASKVYFSETLAFSGNFARNSYGVTSSSIHSQRLSADNFNIANILKTIIKSGRKLYEIQSETKYFSTPETRLTATDVASGAEILNQTVKKKSFFNHESTSFTWETSSYVSFGTALAFEMSHDSFISGGRAYESPSGDNHVSGYRILTSAQPFIKIKFWKATWKTSVPLTLYNIKYHNLLADSRHRYNHLLPELTSSLSCRFNPLNYISASAGRKHTVGDMRDFIDNPLHTTFRNIRTLGTGNLNKGHEDFINLSYSYRDIMAGFFLNFFLSMKKTERNAIAIHDVSSEGTSNSFKSSTSKGDMTSLQINVSKKVKPWNTTFYLNGNSMWRSSESIRSSSLVKTKSSSYSISAKVETYQISDMLMVSANTTYSVSRQSYGTALPSSSFNSFSIFGKIGIYPVKNLELYATADYSKIKLGDNNYKNNFFVDAGIRYSLKRFDFELKGTNLTDMRRYEYTIYNSMDITFSSYDIRPLELTASVKYRF